MPKSWINHARLAMALLASTALALASAPQASASAYTYDQFSRITQRSAGQYWQGGAAAGQWAWTPNPDGSSGISWGDPATWPPPTFEHFTHDNDWVYLEGYADRATGAFLPLVTTSESIGDVNCQHMTPLPSSGGRQHYTKWIVPDTAYCLDAAGHLIYQGTVIKFRHRQVWFPPSGPSCDNSYFAGQICIKQYERYWDDIGNPGGPLVLRQWRDHILALNLGGAYIVHDWATGWEAHGRHYWTY